MKRASAATLVLFATRFSLTDAASAVAPTRAYEAASAITTRPTQPFEGQKPGTSGRNQLAKHTDLDPRVWAVDPPEGQMLDETVCG